MIGTDELSKALDRAFRAAFMPAGSMQMAEHGLDALMLLFVISKVGAAQAQLAAPLPHLLASGVVGSGA